MTPDLDVGKVHVGGEEVAVCSPRHPLLHLALRRVEDGLVRARSREEGLLQVTKIFDQDKKYLLKINKQHHIIL